MIFVVFAVHVLPSCRCSDQTLRQEVRSLWDSMAKEIIEQRARAATWALCKAACDFSPAHRIGRPNLSGLQPVFPKTNTPWKWKWAQMKPTTWGARGDFRFVMGVPQSSSILEDGIFPENHPAIHGSFPWLWKAHETSTKSNKTRCSHSTCVRRDTASQLTGGPWESWQTIHAGTNWMGMDKMMENMDETWG